MKLKKKIINIQKKIEKRAKSGFSIIEMLMAVLILLLATQLIAQAVRLAAEKFYVSTNRSEAQMIVSTLSDFIRSEITTAGEIELNGNDLASFIDASGRLGGRCELVIDDGKLVMKQLTGDSKKYYPVGGPEKPYGKGMRLSECSITIDGEKKVFTVKLQIEDSKQIQAESSFFVVPFAGRIAD